MNRSHRLLFGITLTLGLLVASAPSGLAASTDAASRLNAPHVPAGPPSRKSIANPNLKADLAALRAQSTPAGFRPTVASKTNAPAAIRAATALRKSMTASQRTQLASAVGKYSVQYRRLLDSTKPSAPSKGRSPNSVEAVSAKLSSLNAKLNGQVRSILSPRQFKLHLAATSPAAAKVSQLSGSPQTLGSYCYYGAYYSALAKWYEYYGYYYSYYNYVTYSGNNAYYGYYYAYYAYVYGPSAVRYLGSAYFSYLAGISDWLGDGSTGTSYAYQGYYDSYYAYIYNYYSYTNDGHTTYAYNAYYYTYYAQYYAYYGYYYGYYYCR